MLAFCLKPDTSLTLTRTSGIKGIFYCLKIYLWLTSMFSG